MTRTALLEAPVASAYIPVIGQRCADGGYDGVDTVIARAYIGGCCA
jgi:hypothetical protein